MKIVIIDGFIIEPEWISEAKGLTQDAEIHWVVEKREGVSIPLQLLEDYNRIKERKIKIVFEPVHKKELDEHTLTTLVHRLKEEKLDPEFVLITSNLKCADAVPELRKEGIDITFTLNLKCVLIGKYLFTSPEQVRLAKELGFERYVEIEYALAQAKDFADFKAKTRVVLDEADWILVLSTVGRYKNSLWR